MVEIATIVIIVIEIRFLNAALVIIRKLLYALLGMYLSSNVYETNDIKTDRKFNIELYIDENHLWFGS